MNAEAIRISAQPQVDPQVCRFDVSEDLFLDGSFRCETPIQARGSNLLEMLFAVEGVREVWVAGRTLTLRQSGAKPWPELAPKVGAVIRAHFEWGTPFIPPPPPALSRDLRPEALPLAEQIRQTLNTVVNPQISGHGGSIELVNFENGKVYVKMEGGCQGCGAAKITLQQGVEKTLRNRFPEIVELIDVTNHAAGTKPFYKP